MGVHWVNKNAPELHGQPFTKTFIYGYYGGQLAFVEPMVTRAYLETSPDYASLIELPSVYPTAGYYPTWYSIRTDPRTHAVSLALEGFVYRPAAPPVPSTSAQAQPPAPVPQGTY